MRGVGGALKKRMLELWNKLGFHVNTYNANLRTVMVQKKNRIGYSLSRYY